MSPEEAQALIAEDPRNADVLFPYLDGEDLNRLADTDRAAVGHQLLRLGEEKRAQLSGLLAIVEREGQART